MTLELWQKRDRMTQEQVDAQQIPAWAISMVGNYRQMAQIPKEVSDWDLFCTIEREEICIFNPEDQIGALRDALDLDELEEDE